MGSTTTLAGRSLRWLIIAIGALLAATLLVLQTPGTARADAPDEPGGDQEQTAFYFAGVITYKDEPLPDIKVSVERAGFSADTLTGADGRWRLYVPEKDAYTFEVDESTLPEGVIVEDNPRGGRVRPHRLGDHQQLPRARRANPDELPRSGARSAHERLELRPAARTGRDRRLAHLRHDRPDELRARRDDHLRRHRRPRVRRVVRLADVDRHPRSSSCWEAFSGWVLDAGCGNPFGARVSGSCSS